MAAHQMTPGQSQTLGCNFDNWSFKKKENTKKSRIGAEVPHPPFFWGMVWTSHPPFFLGMEAIPKKKGGKKRGILLFLYRWPTIPLFF